MTAAASGSPAANTLRRVLGRRIDTDDLVQGVLIRLWKNDLRCFRCLDPRRCPIHFLVTLGVRLFVDGWRSQRRHLDRAHRGARRVVVMHSAVPMDRLVDYRLIPQAVRTAIDEFLKTLTAKGREVFLRVVLNVAAEEPGDEAREPEDTPGGESARQTAKLPPRASQAEERMMERMAVRFRKEAGA